MAVSLGYWQSADGRAERVYVNGLPISGKVWLQMSGSRMVIRCSEGPDFDEGSVRDYLADLRPGETISWPEIVEIAQGNRGRGRRPGQTAASRANGYAGDFALPASNDADAIQTDIRTHPIPEPVTLLVDHREPAEMVDRLRTVTNLEVDVRHLDLGDYVLPESLIIERKTVADFVTSVTADDKRLFHQTDRLAEVEGARILLLEGDIYAQSRMSLLQLTGAMSFIVAIQNVSFIPTVSLAHSAHMIAKLVRHRKFGLGYDLGLRGAAPAAPSDAAAYILEGVPGVSATRARTLLRHFGSLRAVALADETALLAVAGIGPSTAKNIVSVFSAAPLR